MLNSLDSGITHVGDDRILVDRADPVWYSANHYIKQVRKGRGTTKVVKGRVKTWFGEIEVRMIPKRRRIYELGSRKLVKELKISAGETSIRYWTEGMIMEFRGARFGREEVTHLGAAMMRAVQELLNIDSSGIETQKLSQRMNWQQLVMLDRGAPTGSSKQVFDQVGAVFTKVQKQLLGCSCRRVCEVCVDLNTFLGTYSQRAHTHLQFVFTQLGR